MKETIKINLGQRLFDLDKEAYDRLKFYLDSLKKYFQRSPKEAEEILQDIEQRIADLLDEKRSEKIQIITSEDIDEVIKMMGTAEEFEFEAETSVNETSVDSQEKDQVSDPFPKENRRLHRDIDNNMLGGVCSGIAAYFNIDIVWIRLAFVLLILLKGAGLIAYIILWIVVPAARTTAQKLQMRGRPVTIENIEQSVKDEYIKVKNNAKNISNSQSFRRMQSTTEEIFSALGSIILVIFKVVFVIIGISLAVAGIFLILGLLAIVPFKDMPLISMHNCTFYDQLVPYMHNLPLFTFTLAIIILIPVISILISSLRFILNIKKSTNVLSAFLWTIWSLALVYIILIIVSGEKVLSFEEKMEDETLLKINNSLVVRIEEESFPSLKMTHYNIFGRKILYNHNNEICYIQPRFIVSNSTDSSYYLIVTRTSSLSFSGHNYQNTYVYDYDWELTDNVLLLNQYFNIDDDKVWTVPGMEINLKVPTGRKVILEGDANALFETRQSVIDTLTTREINF